MVVPAWPGAGLVIVQSHVALLRLELRFNAPPGTAHVGQRLQGSVLGSVGQIVAGLAAVQVPAVDGPVDFAGLPLAGWPHPLGAEPVAAGTLASLGHRYLPPGIPRQFFAALGHGPALTVSQPGLAGTPPVLICRTGACSWSFTHPTLLHQPMVRLILILGFHVVADGQDHHWHDQA